MELLSPAAQLAAHAPAKVDVCRLQILDDKYGVCLFDYCRRWFVDTTAQGAASVVRSMVKFASTLKSSGLSSASFTFPLPPECHYAAERLRMVVHSASGVTGALFFAAAPLITEQDAVLEAHAQALLEKVVSQFTSTQLPILEAIDAQHLIKAKDGGREDEVMHHFNAFFAAAEAALAPHLPRRITRRQVAIQSALRARGAPQSLADAPAAAAASAANIAVRHSRQAKTAVNILNTPGRERYGGGAAQETAGGSAERVQKVRKAPQPKTPGHSRSVSMFQSPSTRGASSSPLAGIGGGRRGGGPVDLAAAAQLASAAEESSEGGDTDKTDFTPDSKSSAPATPPDLPVASVRLPGDAVSKRHLPSATAQSQLAAWAESSDSDNESFSAAAVAASLRGGEGGSTPSAPGSQSKTVSFVE